MNGVLVVDKPVGPTSHDVVARARRALGTRRIGHTGTLDPLASGVLPLVVGQATRLARFLSGDDKTYLAGIRFGVATSTYDAEGEPGERSPVTIGRDDVEAALAGFRGAYQQMPPPYSAKKIAGTPAYKLARQGRSPTLAPVEVVVRELTLLEFDGSAARLRVDSSAGFYVRTLAHELGRALGCGAHLEALRRERAGAFGLAEAVALAELEASGPAAAEALVPLARLLPDLTHVTLSPEGARRAGHGSPVGPADLVAEYAALLAAPGTPVRLLDIGGELLGIAEPDGRGSLHPTVVLV